MNLFNEYALLFAVATPVVAIVGLQVYLFVNGERGTLLMPGQGDYPSVAFSRSSAEVFTIQASTRTPARVPSNDFDEREAA